MKFAIASIFSILLFAACQEKPVSVAGGIDLSGFETKEVEGTESFYAIKKGPDGNILEEGIITSGLQDGTWVTYWTEEDDVNKIKTVTTYVNGTINGPYMEFNERGQVEKRAAFLNNQFHGLYSEYKFGRPIKEYNYNEGVLDGVSKEYSDRGNILKETSHKAGKLEGTYKQYDEEGNILLEYIYKNGKKVSGGMIESK